jgi:hypothetical protein
MTSLRVAVADDEFLEGQAVRDRVRGSLVGAVRSLNPSIDDLHIEFYDDLEPAREAVLSGDFDLVIIDIWWTGIASGSTEAGIELLRECLKNPAQVTVAMSADCRRLLELAFDTQRPDTQPHSILHKDHIARQDFLCGVLKTAFSAARLPLQSVGQELRIEADPGISSAGSEAVSSTVVFELLSMLVEGPITDGRVRFLGGGLSGCLTLAADFSTGTTGRPVPRSLVLKMAQEPWTLREERHNHSQYIGSFPAGQFAHILDREVTFGGWSCVAFDAVRGRTLSEILSSGNEEPLKTSPWELIFHNDLMEHYAVSGAAESHRICDWLIGSGWLSDARWERVVRAAEALKLPDAKLEELRGGVANIFENTHRQIVLSLCHGDLHTRNVMLSADMRRCFWVDAASIQPALWCEDLARLGVWIACEILEANPSMLRAEAGGLRAALSLDDIDGEAEAILALNRCMKVARDGIAEALGARGLSIDSGEDWRLAARVELLRVGYSREMFTPAVRRCALVAALG